MAIIFTPAPDMKTKVSVTKIGLIISRFCRMNSSCSENWGVFFFFSHLVSCLSQVRVPWAIPSKEILCLTLVRSSPSHKRSESLRSSVHACVLSCFSCVWLFVTPWAVTRRVPLSMGFSRQEYWSGLPCPPPGDLPYPGIEPVSLISPTSAGRFFTTTATWEAQEAV